MPVQTQQSSLAAKFGGRIAAANAEHKDKPLDLGFRRLPPGIRNGVGKLQTVVMKVYGQEEKIVVLRGQEYLHVVGVVKHPTDFNGEKIEGHQMFLRFPLCDIPANPANQNSKPVSLSDNWYEFQQFFMRFGIEPPAYNQQNDPTGQLTLGFYFAAIKTLNDKILQGGNNAPHYEFITRSWTPPKTPQQPDPKEIIFEDWGKQCQWSGKHNPAAGVTEAPPTNNSVKHSEPFTEPPMGQVMVGNQPVADLDPADVVAALVETAMNDPEGATDDGAAATAKLEDMAWAVGWTKEHTAAAADWAAIGDMVLNPPTPSAPTQPTVTVPPSTPPTAAEKLLDAIPVVPGAKFKFAKRAKDGAKLKNNKGEEFSPQDVEVATVNLTNKTCTVKTKDGKDVVDIRTKNPIDVKFEWLE